MTILTTHEAFNEIMDTLCSNVKNIENFEGNISILLNKNKLRIVVSQQISLDGIDQEKYQIEISPWTTTIFYKLVQE